MKWPTSRLNKTTLAMSAVAVLALGLAVALVFIFSRFQRDATHVPAPTEISTEQLVTLLLAQEHCDDIDEALYAHIKRVRVWTTTDYESMRPKIKECLKAAVAKELHKAQIEREKASAQAVAPARPFAEQSRTQ